VDVSSTIWRLVVTFAFVLINGFFVAAEFALVKARPLRMAALARQGNRRARLVEQMLARLDLYLSACQLGITIASLILGWLAEPAVARLLIAGADAAGVTLDPHLVHGVALALALTIVTILHMTVGEQGPKIWAIHRAESMSLGVAYPLHAFALVFRPLIWVVNVLSNLLLRGIGLEGGEHAEPPPDSREIRMLLARSATAGHISRRQRELAENVLGIARLEVRHILVPRIDVVWLDLDQPLADNLATMRQSGHSRFPVGRGDLDRVVGVVHAKSVLAELVEGHQPDLGALARKPVFVPENQPVARMIHELQRAGSGCAMVVDEHGVVVGVVFLDDALEEIVGPLPDEFDELVEDHREVEPGVYEVEGAMALPFASELLGLDELGDEDTIGGYVVGLLKRLPEPGDELEIGPFKVTVSEVRDRRAERLRFVRKGEGSAVT
jgi:CBS domain containing-hemolysin-like protein